MNSRVSWSAEGIDPSVRERAEAAARRAGMSLSEWLNSTIDNSSPPSIQESRDVADIHQRLDSITRQIEQISRPPQRQDVSRNDATRSEPGVAGQLNNAISRLDARLAQISNSGPARQAQFQDSQRQTEMVERAAAQVYRPSPPLSPASLDFAVAEISARQSELDQAAPRPLPPRGAPSMAPAMPAGPDFSTLERHLVKITSQIEALQRPDGVEQSIAAFRSELTEIRHAITEAMPRRAIQSIENEIRSLTRRIDDTRQSGTDGQALAGIERALGEIRQSLAALKPAEQLAGYDDAIRNLGAKLDLIVRSSDDPSTIRQLEGAIAALRSIVSNVASNDALARLSDDLRMLSSKVDLLGRSEGNGNYAALEQRIATLTSTIANREPSAVRENSEQLESALRALSDRLDRMPVGKDSASSFAHLEQRVSYLLERLEASGDPRGGNLARVEDGLQDVLHRLEAQHANLAALTGNGRGDAKALDGGLVDVVKRELSDIRLSQTETDRHTQGSLEAVHNTLGHVVDRLAIIEGDLRNARATPVAPPHAPQAAAAHIVVPPQPKPELPNPAAAQKNFAAAPREFLVAQTPVPAVAAKAPQGAISEILDPQTTPRTVIAPGLPPDHPLEPGTRPAGRVASPSERIAASEDAIGAIAASPREPAGTSDFIAAARRAAQAAATAPPGGKNASGKAARAAVKDKARDGAAKTSTVTSKIRSLLVGASVVVIVLGTFKMAMTLLDSGPPPIPAMEDSSEPPTPAQPPADNGAKPATSAPSTTSPAGRQSLNTSAPNASDGIASVAIPQASPAPVSTGDVTGAIPAMPTAPSNRRLALVQVPPTERLPDAIGGPMLRTAALKGDPTAAYEIGVRFAEGKSIAPNLDEAAKWYERAARAGVVPAMFRLGTFYEKGLSVKKDVDVARQYYMQAAERGNAKAMHNMAVLEADGGGKGANYKNASQWFRKAADRGVADSQFNLGILYARGIGVEQNLAESFKWFSLAAAQGDADSVRKRDDIAKRLDAQSLAAAKLAIQTFTPEPQPDDAINVATPAGGWDPAPAQAKAAKPVAKPALVKRAATAG